jgi:hypothetical protein
VDARLAGGHRELTLLFAAAALLLLTIDPALRQADRRIVEQATILLYRPGELAEQRPAEIGRP